MNELSLNNDELTAVAAVGARRHIEALYRPDKNFPDTDNVRWHTHIEAAGAELAVAKARDRYWCGCGLQSRYDVAGAQVRSITKPHHSLVLRESDLDEDAYILVYAKAPRYTLLGWLWGYEGKRDEFLVTNERDEKPYWQVPQTALRPMP